MLWSGRTANVESMAAQTMPVGIMYPPSMSSTTLLAHLTDKLTSQRENAATEAVAFVLNRSERARRAFARHVAPLVGEMAAIHRVETQYVAGDESRPDIVLLGADGAVIGYIEAKFWAALTAAQPVAYLKRLAETRANGGLLFMLAPDRRLETLRTEIVERCRPSEHVLIDRGAMAFDAGVNRLALISWSGLLSALRDAVVDDPATLSDLGQLQGLCERFESEGFVPLTRADIDDLEVPRRVLALANLVNDIVDTAVAREVLSVKGSRPAHYVHATGRYVSLPRAGGWFGLNHKLWLERGQSPMWMRFNAGSYGRSAELRGALSAWVNARTPRAFLDDDGAIRLPVPLRTGVEKQAVVDASIEYFRGLDRLMLAAGMSLRNAEPPPDAA